MVVVWVGSRARDQPVSPYSSNILKHIVPMEGFVRVIAADYSGKAGLTPAVPISDSPFLSHP
jgi:hypothetical protein